MMMITLQIGPEGQPPSEFRIFAMGENRSSKGTVVLDATSARAVLDAFADHGMDRLPIDYGHGMVFRDDHRSAGWFTPELRDDGLWAVNVEWTPRAFDALKAREFRFISPAFRVDEKQRVVELLNVALTNLPATKDALPLVASLDEQPNTTTPTTGNDKEDDMSDKLIKLLGADDEGEALVIAAEINTLSRDLLATTGTKTLSDAMAAVKANATLPAVVAELNDKLAAVEAAEAEREREDLIKKLSDDKKLPPVMHDWARTITLDALKAYGESAPVHGGAASPNPVTEPADQIITLSDEQKRVAKAMGISDEALIDELKAEKARGTAMRVELDSNAKE